MAVNNNEGPQTPDFPVVGIGASAGGLEALQGLFSLLPAKTGLAFVVIQHLLPDHPSYLAELIGKRCRLPVCEAQDGMAVEPDYVYLIAPGEVLVLDQGILRSRPLPAHAPVRIDLIDTFFKSLAADQGRQAIAVILSGTGSDGTTGVVRIKQTGGTVFVQNPTTAMHGGMPCAAIATGAATHILPVDGIARELLASTAAAPLQTLIDTRPEGIAQPLDEILTLIRQQTGTDMSGYKFNPLFWQIQQRMQARRLSHVHEYAAQLRQEPAELETLVRKLPIHVTEFFRDPDAWDLLQSEVIAPLVREHRGDRPIRVWTPACSSGEEAYSVAMLLAEQFDQSDTPADFQIFATDASPEIVARAGRGLFSGIDLQALSPERQACFFDADEKHEGKYRVKKQLREKLVFAPQHLLADPPFSDLDMVTCRNFLIYLEPYAQKQVLARLHASLRLGGCLFLGRGESLISNQDGFETISSPWRLYRKTAPLADTPVRFPKPLKRLPTSRASKTLGAESAHWAVLEEFDLPSVLIDAQLNILHVYGDISPFLRLPPGQPTLNLLAMLLPSWVVDIQVAAEKAQAEHRPVTVDGLREATKSKAIVSIKLTPIRAGETQGTTRLLVSFIHSSQPDDRALPGSDERALSGESARQPSIQAWSDTLQLTIEELEASREELQVLNEELRAVNDQLNLSNEEINEVNAQLRDKIQELETQSHVLSSGAVMTLFLDQELRVRWFTPAMSALFPLHSYDTGRKITELVPQFVDPHFIGNVQAVMQTGEPLEGEVRSLEDRWYLRRIGPFRNGRDKTAGVAITFTDITGRKRIEKDRDRFVALADASTEFIGMCDQNFRPFYVNAAGMHLVGLENLDAACAVRVQDYFFTEDQAFITDDYFPRALQTGNAEVEIRFRHFQTGEAIWMLYNVFTLRDENGEVIGWATVSRNIHQRKQVEEALQRERSLLVSVMQTTDFMLVFLDPQFNFVWVNPAYAATCGMTPEAMVGKNYFDLYPNVENEAIFRHVRESGEAVCYKDKPFVFPDQPERGTTYWNWSLIPVKTADGSVSGLVFSLQETTKLKQVQEALQHSEYRLRRFYDSGLLGIIYWNMDGKIIDANDKFLEMVGYDREDLAAGRIDWQQMTPPEYRHLDEQGVRDLLATGVNVAPFEKEYIRKDGTRLPVILSGATLDEARFNGVAFVLDITEQKQAEEGLRKSRAKLARELEDAKQLQKVSRLLIEDKSGEGLYETLIDSAMTLMRADFASLQILDAERGELQLFAWRNFHPESAAYWQTVSVKSGTTCGSALQHGERIIIPDVNAADISIGSETRRHFQLSGIAAVQSTPLTTRKGRVIGMISTHWRQPHTPSERVLVLLDVLARQVADAIERRRTLEALWENEAWLAAQKEAFQAIINGAPLEESLGVLVNTAVKQAGTDVRCAFYLADPAGQKLHHVAGMAEAYAECVDGFKIGSDSLACGLAVYTGQPVVTPDVNEAPQWKSWLWLAERYEFRGCWSFPIEASSGKIVGTFAMYFKTLREATPRDYEFAGALTRAAAIIISHSQEAEERARVEAKLHGSKVQLAADLAALTRIHELSRFPLEDETFEIFLQKVMDAAVVIVGSDYGTLQLLEGNSLRIVAQYGHTLPFLHFFASAEHTASVCGEATKQGKRVIVDDVEQSPIFVGTESLNILRTAGVRAVQSTPIMSRNGTLLGILTTQWGRVYHPQTHDLWRIDLLVRQVADALERRRALDALHESEECLKFALDASYIGTWDLDLVTQTVYRSLEHDRIFGYDRLLPEWTPDMFFDHLLPEDRAAVEARFHEATAQHSDVSFECRICRRDNGEVRWIWVTGRHRENTRDKRNRMTGIIQDITARKQAEEISSN